MQREQELAKWEMPLSFASTNAPDLDPEILSGTAIAEYCIGLAREIQVSLALPVMDVLGALATANQRRYCVHVQNNHVESLNLFLVCALESGNRKSPTLAACFKPIDEWEQEADRVYGPKIREVASLRLTIQRNVEFLRSNVKKCGANMAEILDRQKEICALEEDMPEEFPLPRLTAQDATPEALARLLQKTKNFGAIRSAEGGFFKTLGGRYANNTPNLDLILQGYSGESVDIDRVSLQNSIRIRPRITTVLNPQPFYLQKMPSEFYTSGFMARFLAAIPPSIVGYRDADSVSMPEEATRKYHNMLWQLLPPLNDPEAPLIVELQQIELSPDALKLWKEYFSRIEVGIREGNELEFIKLTMLKMPGNVIRIAGNLHCAMHAGGNPAAYKIDLPTMQTAIAFGDFFTEQAKAIHSFAGLDTTTNNAKKLLAWIKRERLTEFNNNMCWDHAKNTMTAEGKESALEMLAAHNYIQRILQQKGRKPSYLNKVSPYVFES